MADINHQVGIKAPPEKIFELLSTDTGLSQWWTNDVSGAGEVGSVIAFRFECQYKPDIWFAACQRTREKISPDPALVGTWLPLIRLSRGDRKTGLRLPQ